jgi:hypothetical protein
MLTCPEPNLFNASRGISPGTSLPRLPACKLLVIALIAVLNQQGKYIVTLLESSLTISNSIAAIMRRHAPTKSPPLPLLLQMAQTWYADSLLAWLERFLHVYPLVWLSGCP